MYNSCYEFHIITITVCVFFKHVLVHKIKGCILIDGEVCGEHDGDENKHQDKREEDEDPRNGGVSGFANNIEQPRPEQYVDDFKNENNGHIGGLASIGTNTIHITSA
jgi:hypothetical protein